MTPALAAATPVPFTGSPAVHAGTTCNPEPVQAAPPATSATSHPAVLPVTQQLLRTSEVAGTLLPAAQDAEEVAAVTALAASRSDPKAAAQGIEEAAPAMAAAGWSDSRASPSLQQPEQVAQPDTVMSEVLPTTAAAICATVEDLPQLSPHAILPPEAPVIGSFTSTATAAAVLERLESTVAAPLPEAQPQSNMFRLDSQLSAADSGWTDTAACETTSIGLEAPQQGPAAEKMASFVQQAPPGVSVSLAVGDVEPAVPMLAPASATDGLKQALPHDITAAAIGTVQGLTDDEGASKAPPAEAQHELAVSGITSQPLCSSESAKADVLSEPFSSADIGSASSILPTELSLTTAPVSVVESAHASATRNYTDPILSAQQAGEDKDTGACIPDLVLKVEKVPLPCTSSDVQDPDNCDLSEHTQLQCTSVPSLASASLEGNGEGTVVMLEGNSLLGLAGYYESDPDSGS